MRITSILAVAVLSSLALSSCEGFNPADAIRIGGKATDLYSDIKDTAAKAKAEAKAKADAKAAQDVQPTAMLPLHFAPVENAPAVKFAPEGLPAVCAFDPGEPTGLPVAKSDRWQIAFTGVPPH